MTSKKIDNRTTHDLARFFSENNNFSDFAILAQLKIIENTLKPLCLEENLKSFLREKVR